MTYESWCMQAETQAYQEFLACDPVAAKIRYVRFVSKSKGRRNGKQRLRRNWREIHLVKYTDGYHLWHNFQFDVYATEIIGQHANAEMLRQRIIDLWGY